MREGDETVNFIRSYDPETLREIVDTSACTERLEDLGVLRSLPALLERVWLLKVLGDLDEALEVSEQSVRVARMAGTRKDLLRARILHASVQQYRGRFGAAEQELLTCAEEAEGQEWWAVAAFAQQHLGRVYYDTGDFGDARTAFKRALFLRQQAGTPDDQLESTLLAIDAADRRGVEASVAS
jgi:tetratricopeptide (TPR) repeat protein